MTACSLPRSVKLGHFFVELGCFFFELGVSGCTAMVRRIASQVHKQASRLLVQQFIKREPAWFQAVLDHPPLPLPPREPSARQDYDLLPQDQLAARTAPAKHMRPAPRRPLPIHYLEDDVRTQFFKDHPFEAYRPRTLVEDAEVEGENPIRGENWTRLRQRGRNPSSEEYVSILIYYANTRRLTNVVFG